MARWLAAAGAVLFSFALQSHAESLHVVRDIATGRSIHAANSWTPYSPAKVLPFGDRWLLTTCSAGCALTITGEAEGSAELLSPESANFANFSVVDGTIYFTVFVQEDGYQLYKSDGTRAGTAPVASRLLVGPFIANFGSKGYFGASDGIYSIDGAGSIEHLVTAATGSVFFWPGASLMYFMVNDDVWVTDGTAAGTRRLLTNPYVGGSVIGDRLVWAKSDGVYALEPTSGAIAKIFTPATS